MAPVSDGYTSRATALLGQSNEAEDNAMSYLQRSLTKSKELTPGQGIAAALLAAVPSVGGFLLGKSVGDAAVPDGLYNVGKLAPTGASIGGQMGAAIGMNSAKSYVDATNARNLLDSKNETDVYQKMSAMEQQRAGRLEQQASAATNAGLALDAEIAMMPLELQQRAKEIALSSSAQLANQKAMADYTDQKGVFSDSVREYAKAQGLEIPVGATASQINAITGAREASRRESGQDIRLSGQALMAPSAKTKEKLDNAISMKLIGDRSIAKLKSIAESDPNLLSRSIDKVLPQTELGKLNQDLQLFAVQMRNSREPGVMTDRDFDRYVSYLTLSPLDTVDSLLKRLQEVQQVGSLSAKATMMSAKAGQENISNYEKLFGYEAPSDLNGLGIQNSPTLPVSGGQKTKQQFLDEALARRGLKR